MKIVNFERVFFAAIAACSASVSLAEPSGDRPNATHAWAVHDVNRPDPVKIEVKPGLPPIAFRDYRNN